MKRNAGTLFLQPLIKISAILIIFMFCFNAKSAASDLINLREKLKENNELPTDPKYWSYYRRYINHSVIDLIVSGRDSKHLYQNLKLLKNLKEQNVLIGRILVVGGNNFAFLDKNSRNKLGSDKEFYRKIKHSLGRRAKNISQVSLRALQYELGISPELAEIAQQIGLEESKQLPSSEILLQEFNIKTSPTWIVSCQNKQVIYEGIEKIDKYFYKNGVFSAWGSLQKKETHLIGNSKIPFIPEDKKASTQRISDEQELIVTMDYDMRPWKTLPGVGTYDALPACSTSSVRKVKVKFNSEELQEFDILYYKHDDPKARITAKNRMGITTPYLPGDLSNPMRNPNNVTQQLARLLDIRCLPTRVHYVTIDGHRYEEYRENERAWDLP